MADFDPSSFFTSEIPLRKTSRTRFVRIVHTSVLQQPEMKALTLEFLCLLKILGGKLNVSAGQFYFKMGR